jgi:transposase
MTKDEQIVLLQAENALLTQKITSLEQKVVQLLQIIEKQGVKKNSSNSHNSPSQDKGKPKRNQSLRTKSQRKSGGQKGHKGHTLKMSEQPDETKILRSDYCQVCGSDLRSLRHQLVSKRQEVVIPPIIPQVIEYQQFGCQCDCGHHQKPTYPTNINAPIQFGSEIVALVSYFNVFQYVPYQRLQLLFQDVFNLSISEGSIRNLLEKGSQKAQPVYQAILENIKQSAYIGSDETGAKVNNSKWWIWVWQNVKNTFLKAAPSRGFTTIEEIFPRGLPNAIIGSDRLAAQLKITSKGKQLCFPHLLLDLNYLLDTEKTTWAQQFKDILKKALELNKVCLAKKLPCVFGENAAQNLEEELNKLLAVPLLKDQHPLTLTFQTQMLKNRNYLFTFLYHLEVPPDNNASERAVRNVKVKQKISGQFKSGQEAFCVLRSVIDTLRKRELNVLNKLKIIMAQ